MSSLRSRQRWLGPAGGLLLFGLVASCSSGDSTSPGQVPADILITPGAPVVGQGLDLQLTAKVVDANRHEIPGTTATFTSGNTLFATVSAAGLVHSVGRYGPVTITATFQGISDSVVLRIAQRLTGISVVPETLIVNRHLTAQLQATPVDFVGQPLFGGPVTFTSGNTGLATVSQSGLVSAQAIDGRTTVTVTVDTFHVSVPVTVTQIPATLVVSQPNLVFPVGGGADLTAQVTDLHGDPIVPAPLTFLSSAPAVFTVSPAGHIASVAGNGSGTISVRAGTLESDVGVYVGNASPGVVVETTPIGVQGYEVAIAPGGQMVVTGGGNGFVVEGALPAFTFGSLVALGSTTFGVVLNHAGTTGYIAADCCLRVLDLASSSQTTAISGFGGGPKFAILISNDDQKLYVGATTGVYRIDLASRLPDDSIALSGPTIFLAMDTVHQRLYASADGLGVQEITLGASMAPGRTFQVSAPRGVGVAPDGSELYVTSESFGDLEVWNLTSGQRTQTVSFGGASGFGLAVSASRIAVTHGNGKVSLFDRASRALLHSVTVTGTPARPAWNTAGTTLVVPNETGWVDFIQ